MHPTLSLKSGCDSRRRARSATEHPMYTSPSLLTHEIIEFQCSSLRFLHILPHNFIETFSNFYHILYI
jgi:hypothetical protein